MYHLVSVAWFKKWQVYTSTKDQDEEHPGPINEDFDFLCVPKDQILSVDPFYGNTFLKDGIREEIHYKVLDD